MEHTTTRIQVFARNSVYLLLLLVPFHAFLTVYGSSLIGHYTPFRLWNLGLLGLISAIALYFISTDRTLRSRVTRSLVVRLIACYILLSIGLALISLVRGEVSLKATMYGLLSNLRYLVWFMAAMVVAAKTTVSTTTIKRILLGSAGIVVMFAILQFAFLPPTFLTHFGYNEATTIAPIETINNNPQFIRVQSTLRGANPLGAYLIIIVAAICTYGLAAKRKPAYMAALMVTLLALFASGSRSAWIGCLLAGFIVLWLKLPSRRAKLIAGNSLLVGLLIVSGVALIFKENVRLQNALLHTQEDSAVMTSSNDAHLSATKQGVADVVRQPFGAGPGTAGPASVYNTKQPARIAENYYIQIAQETGWLGLILFLGIILATARELYRRAAGSPLALLLFASLIGISFVCLLSHAWADDTLAFLWWGLAGLALSGNLKHAEYTA